MSRTENEIAESLYPNQGRKTIEGFVIESTTEEKPAAPPKPQLSDEQRAAILYPDQSGDAPSMIDEDDGTGKRKQACTLYDMAAHKIHESFGYRDPADLASARGGSLGSANLEGLTFSPGKHSLREGRLVGASFRNGRLDGMDLTSASAMQADFRGCSMRNVQAHFTDFRQCLFDENTNVEGMDVTGALFTDEQILQAKGFDKIKGDRKGRW